MSKRYCLQTSDHDKDKKEVCGASDEDTNVTLLQRIRCITSVESDPEPTLEFLRRTGKLSEMISSYLMRQAKVSTIRGLLSKTVSVSDTVPMRSRPTGLISIPSSIWQTFLFPLLGQKDLLTSLQLVHRGIYKCIQGIAWTHVRVRVKGLSTLLHLRRSISPMYRTLRHLCLYGSSTTTPDIQTHLDDFVVLESLHLKVIRGRFSLPPSLRHIRIHYGNVVCTILPSQLKTVWLEHGYLNLIDLSSSSTFSTSSISYTSSTPSTAFSITPTALTRLHISVDSQPLSPLLQGCASTLEQLSLEDVTYEFPEGLVFPRLEVVYYTDNTRPPVLPTLPSFMYQSVLTHLCYCASRLPSLDRLAVHAHRLVYLELVWGMHLTSAHLSEEATILTEVLHSLVPLEALQYLVLNSPPLSYEVLATALVSLSRDAFPHLRYLSTSLIREGRMPPPPTPTPSSPTPIICLHSEDTNTTLYYPAKLSSTLHIPLICNPCTNDISWKYPHCPLLYNHSPYEIFCWSRSPDTLMSPPPPHSLVTIVEWCGSRRALFDVLDERRISNHSVTCSLTYLSLLVIGECPYKECICRL